MSSTRQPIKAVILDWAGVTVDHGSLAPARVFVDVFRRHGIEITNAEAREPMGKAKRDHVIAITEMPRIATLWQQTYGRTPNDADIQKMYDDFLPLQLDALAKGTQVIAGVTQAVDALRQQGLKIGSTTGYTRELMDVVVPIAARGGYSPDVVICADDVTVGRPAPWMNFLAAQQLDVYPFSNIVVIDDTKVGIEAGNNAGATTVAISRTGNSLGLSAEQTAALPPAELESKLLSIRQDFLAAGADYVIESLVELPELIRTM